MTYQDMSPCTAISLMIYVRTAIIIEKTSCSTTIISGWDPTEWLGRLTANAVVLTILGSIPASSDRVESEGRQMKQC